MAGAKVTMVASELLQNGIRRVRQVLNELRTWMTEHEYESVMQMIGAMSQKHCAEPAAFERANYMKTLDSYRPLLLATARRSQRRSYSHSNLAHRRVLLICANCNRDRRHCRGALVVRHPGAFRIIHHHSEHRSVRLLQ